MANNNRIYVDPVMKFYIESETRKLADQIKKQHGLTKLTIPFVTGSQWIGNILMKKKAMIRYRVKKISLNEGILEFI